MEYMKSLQLKKHLDKVQDLTILVPTHNRKKQLIRCLNSIHKIFKNYCNIVICDNSSKKYENVLDIITTEKYINLRNYEGKLQDVYLELINSVQTKYCLIVEDDDQLININTHIQCLLKLNAGFKVVTFAAKDNNTQYLNRLFNKDDLINVPFFWNGEFQFGLAYFEINTLKKAFNLWCTDIDMTNIITSDEAITFIAIMKSQSYSHINAIGMKIGIADDNLSWNNFIRQAYSTAFYIDSIAKKLNIFNKDWIYRYKNIQLNELQTMSKTKITYEMIFNNKIFKNIFQTNHFNFNFAIIKLLNNLFKNDN